MYETEPMYVEDQDWFLNCVAILETTLSPRSLLDGLHEVEAALGRTRGRRYGPREIDLDILFYDDERVALPDLEIPHPRIAERLFVLAPLSELAPDLVHPTLHKTVREMKDGLRTESRVVKRPDVVLDPSS